MEKQHYILNLSLKQLALRKVAVGLWKQPDILPLVKSFRCQSRNDDYEMSKWQKLVEKVKEKVPMLLLPDSLAEDLMHVIKPIGPEILKWRMHHKAFISNSCSALNILNQLCWTSIGTVDYKKTAEILIRQERIDLTSSYKLACLYCLEDDIRIIWEKLSEGTKKLFYDEVSPLYIKQQELVTCWTYLIKGEVARLDGLVNKIIDARIRTLNQYAFESASTSGNKAASEYFFQKLTVEEKEASLLDTFHCVVRQRCYNDAYSCPYEFPKENFCDVACFLLSQMKEEEQIQMFKKLPYKTLRCFMDWPWQDLFMKVAGLMWSFFPADEYYSLIRILAKNRTMTGFNYPQLFGEFFLHAPSLCRDYIIGEHRENGVWFRDLIYANNTEMIKLVLRNVDDEDRPGFIICDPGCQLCLELMKDRKWILLELFVSECRLSSTDKTLLKETFKNYIARFYMGLIKWSPDKWERFFQLIDNAKINETSKRITEDVEKEQQSTSNEPKRKRTKLETNRKRLEREIIRIIRRDI